MNEGHRWSLRKSPLHKFLDLHADDMLAVRGSVVVIADDSSQEQLAAWAKHATGRLHVISETPISRLFGAQHHVVGEQEALSETLLRVHPIAVLADATMSSIASRISRFEKLVFHITEGGSFVAPEGELKSLWHASRELVQVDRIGNRERKALDDSTDEPRESFGVTAIRVTREHLLKVREDEANRLIPARNPELHLEILDELSGGRFDWPSKVYQHGDSLHFPNPSMVFHDVYLRHYRGPVKLGSHMLATTSGSILPSSFRHPHLPRINSTEATPVNDRFALLKDAEKPAAAVDGDFYDLSASVDGHFGHVLTESLAKIWGWDEAKRRLPGLRAVYRLPSEDYVPTVERTLFHAYGISEDDIHWATRNESVNSFVSASLLWQNGGQRHFHPAIKETWDRLRAALVTPDSKRPGRIFVSRKFVDVNRSCRNLTEVEDFFRGEGFEIVYPEVHPLTEQAQIFGNADTIAGFAGSGMFNMLFAQHLSKIVVLSHSSYTARNELMYGAMLSDETHYFWSAAEIAHPPGSFSEAAFHSPWSFDFDLNEDELRATLGT